MADIIFTITAAGRAALINAENTGTAAVLIASAGLSASVITASPGMTALPGEFKRVASLSGDTVADDMIHLLIRDESSDVFSVRALALYLDDGTLFGLYGQPSVILEKTSQSMMLLRLDVRFVDVDATTISFGDANFLNPPATTERQGVIELATVPETQAGTDQLRAVTPYTLKVTFSDIWRASNDGAGSGLDADLLDGYHGSAFARVGTDVTFRDAVVDRGNGTGVLFLGGAGRYLSFDSSAFNLIGGGLYIDGAVNWTAANDGAGSGLDADLLDGLHASAFLQMNAGGRSYHYDYAGGASYITGDTGGFEIGYYFRDYLGSKFGGFGAYGGGSTINYYYVGPGLASPYTLRVYPDRIQWGDNPIWHSANDGAGSGLDADLLDGQEASAFALLTGASFSGPVVSAGAITAGTDGFKQSSYLYNTRNPIWRFANSDAYGFSYFQGAAGSYGNDTIGFHFGSATALSSIFAIHAGGGADLSGRLLATGGAYFGDQIFRNGNVVWDAGNDGAESGLDADMLDGYHAAAFAREGMDVAFRDAVVDRGDGTGVLFIGGPARHLSFDGSAFNLTGGGLYIAGAVAWTAANDGAGSGMDADLLDGQQGSWYADIAARLGYTPVQMGTGIGQLTNVVKIGWSGARLKATVDATDFGNLVFDSNVSDVWRASNDGSGSGLDADMLDGFEASAFDRIVSQNLTANGGYIIYASGRKETWGVITIGQDTYATYYLPCEHSDWVHPTYGTSTQAGNTQIQQNTGITSINGAPPTSITFWNADDRTVTIWVRTTGV